VEYLEELGSLAGFGLIGAHFDDQLLSPRQSSFVGFILHPRVYRDPVDLPGLAPVIRECLFETARIPSDVRPDISHENGSPVQCFLIEELAAPILELTDRGLAQRAAAAVGRVETPLVGLGIVETQRQNFEVTCWAIGLELREIGAAIPNLSDDGRALVFDPGS